MHEEHNDQKELDKSVKSLTVNLLGIHELVSINPEKFVKVYSREGIDPILMSKNEDTFWGIIVSKDNSDDTRGMLGRHNEIVVAWMLESDRKDYEALVKPVIEKVRRNYPALVIFAPYYDKGEWIEDNPIITVEFPYRVNTQVPNEHMAIQLILGMRMLEEGILEAIEQS